MERSVRFAAALALGIPAGAIALASALAPQPAVAQSRRGPRCPATQPTDGASCPPPEGRICRYPRMSCRCVNESPTRGLAWECNENVPIVRQRPVEGPLAPPEIERYED